MTSSTRKDGNTEIFQWTFEEMMILCETCLQYIAKHWRAQIFTWKEIQLEVEKKIGCQCGVDPFLEDKGNHLFGDSYAMGKNIYTPSMEPSQPIILENDEEDESSENDDLPPVHSKTLACTIFAWKEIQPEVEKKIGHQCGANSGKYKYDTMKNNWRLRKQLKTSETRLRWNAVTRKIEASDEWWLKKIEENKKFQSFEVKVLTPFSKRNKTTYLEILMPRDKMFTHV
ncbi:hypothetical protein Cgig2_012915 [Carnegiea gigantea]|uniref:Myb/SANT-like domain-containing protein n=1 Tax=Carnegiea gigantea TaxID=171969 RepID=A0A9Q1Q6Y2_9CARY|nr:hypothetical protein Cgig2_012915 [Carnegiea gigantea]